MPKLNWGKTGEQLAADFLQCEGYAILERNYRDAGGEIDLIASKDGCILFVEVKLRKNIEYGYPREAVNRVKQQKIKKVAEAYVARQQVTDTDCRFDVIEILVEDGMRIEHIPNAFW